MSAKSSSHTLIQSCFNGQRELIFRSDCQRDSRGPPSSLRASSSVSLWSGPPLQSVSVKDHPMLPLELSTTCVDFQGLHDIDVSMRLRRSLGQEFFSRYLLARRLLPPSRESFKLWKIRELSSAHSPQAMPERQCLNKEPGGDAYTIKGTRTPLLQWTLQGPPEPLNTHPPPDTIRGEGQTPAHVHAHTQTPSRESLCQVV